MREWYNLQKNKYIFHLREERCFLWLEVSNVIRSKYDPGAAASALRVRGLALLTTETPAGQAERGSGSVLWEHKPHGQVQAGFGDSLGRLVLGPTLLPKELNASDGFSPGGSTFFS